MFKRSNFQFISNSHTGVYIDPVVIKNLNFELEEMGKDGGMNESKRAIGAQFEVDQTILRLVVFKLVVRITQHIISRLTRKKLELGNFITRK